MLCELGDGAVNMGAWHASLNLAAVWRLPVVYLVMNNEYGMGTSVERASAVTELYRRAAAYDMASERIDGGDLLAVARGAATLLEAGAREDRQPAVLELVTYRYRGHSVADAGSPTAAAVRSTSTSRHDPIFRVRELLAAEGVPDGELDRPARRRGAARRGVGRHRAREPGAGGRGRWRAACTPDGSAAQFARMLPGSPYGERELVFAGGLGA